MTRRVAHLTSAHPWRDPRIFQKMCLSLSSNGYDVHIVAAHGPDPGGDRVDGIQVHLFPEPRSRLDRMTRTNWRLYKKAIEIKADIYHFHDPEMIPVGLLLRLGGCRVIYDVHEDMPKRIMDREWLPEFVRPIVGWLITGIQKIGGALFSAVVSATPAIARRFNPKTTVIVRNYPRLDEFSGVTIDWPQKTKTIIFIGAIDISRGVLELIEGFRGLEQGLGARLVIAGRREGGEYEVAIDEAAEGLGIEFPGFVDRETVGRLLEDAMVGAVTSLPCDLANEGISTKLFEYMAAGIPVISTDMPSWSKVIEGADCGTAVDPTDPRQITAALEYWLRNPDAARRAGANGRKAIEETYNWEHEYVVLQKLYYRLNHD